MRIARQARAVIEALVFLAAIELLFIVGLCRAAASD